MQKDTAAALQSGEKLKYEVLDGMRGVAAIAVVMFHAASFFGALRPPSAYLAVDFFFALSGFVLGYAYDRRLAGGMSAVNFMLRRLIRLYPLYIAGTCLTFVASLIALFVTYDASH
jgi:peptidoglycan/LPS O-acetylase OafA/YrhL